MRNRKKFYIILVWILFLFPIVNCVGAIAKDKEDYIGMDKGDKFIWSVDYDEDAAEDMYVDMGLNISYLDIDEDIEALKIVILKIDEEDEHHGNDGVEIEYNYYETEDYSDDDWKLEDEGEKGIIYKYDDDEDDIIEFYQYCAYEGVFFVANDVDWEYVVEEWDDDLDDDGSAQYIGNRISIHIDDDTTYIGNVTYYIHDIYISCEYNSDGVLKYYKFDYYSDTFVKAELKDAFFQEFGSLIIIILIALVGIALIVTLIIVSTKRSKKKIEKVVKEEKKEEIIPVAKKIEEEKKELARFCPDCGNPAPAGTRFCEACGKDLNE